MTETCCVKDCAVCEYELRREAEDRAALPSLERIRAIREGRA